MTPLERIEAALGEMEAHPQVVMHKLDGTVDKPVPRLIAALRKAVQGLEIYERNAWLVAVAKALTGPTISQLQELSGQLKGEGENEKAV